MLAGGNQEMETLLASLRGEKKGVEALRLGLEKERDELQGKNTELENELQRLKAEGRKVVQETRDRVLSEAVELLKEIRQAASELRKEKSKERIEQARRAVAAAHERLESEVWQAKTDERTDRVVPDDSRISPGDIVWLKEASLQATVLSVSPETQQVEVQAGQSRFRLSLDGVEKVTLSGATPEFTPVKRQISRRTVSHELDLRGKRAIEIEQALDSYLNDASLANLSQARIIHGFATGTVRNIVRELLAVHPLVKSFRPGQRGEGGDGVTIVGL
jgi:DNA mismatch repair protein MutS2